MCFLKELRPLANVSIFSVCHVHGHASLFLDRLGFQYKLNGPKRSEFLCICHMYMCIMLCQVGHIINNNGENAAKLAKEKKIWL